SARLPASLLRVFSADRGFAHLWLTIAANGRVSDCSVLQSSGNDAVDQALCNVMLRRSRWEPARDAQGRPLTVRLRYTATWTKVGGRRGRCPALPGTGDLRPGPAVDIVVEDDLFVARNRGLVD